MKIFLIGYMGCGKSRWGKQLAKKLNADFIDLDNFIEEQQGETISEIFERAGEDAFRKIEQKALRSLLNQDNVIVATGGGTPCHNNNMDWMNVNGTSVFLKADSGILASRILNSDDERPLVKNMNKEELINYIDSHLKLRLPFYLKAHHVITASNLKISQLVELFNE